MYDKTRIWLTTDTHYNHYNIMKHCGRPVDFEERIERGLYSNIKATETLIHLGDIALPEDAEAHEMYVQKWPWKKILVRGNHDKRSLSWYVKHGWTFACDGLRLDVYGKKVWLSHRPAPLGDWDINIHGHCHNLDQKFVQRVNVELDATERTNKHVLLALEYTNYQPITLERVIQRGAPRGREIIFGEITADDDTSKVPM